MRNPASVFFATITVVMVIASSGAIAKVQSRVEMINGKKVSVVIIPAAKGGRYLAISHAQGERICYLVGRSVANKKSQDYMHCGIIAAWPVEFVGGSDTVTMGTFGKGNDIVVTLKDLQRGIALLNLSKYNKPKTQSHRVQNTVSVQIDKGGERKNEKRTSEIVHARVCERRH